jgi:RNA polymerase sigma-70 factor (ECF subfamily)
MPQPTEPEIIERACLGDHQAFKSLVESYQGFVFSIAFKFTRDSEEAEDLVQDCFVRLWKNLRQYNPDYKLKSWLGKMITNIGLDYIKSAARKQQMSTVNIESGFEVASTPQESELHASELQNIILQLADSLTPKQKAAFILRDLEMLDVQEVCDLLDESAENLKSNLYHARKYIRENVLKYYNTSLL